MKDFRLDEDGDFSINDSIGDLRHVNNDLQQKVWLLLNTNTSELDWNEDIGISFLELIANADNTSVLQQIINEYLENQLPDLFDYCEITSSHLDTTTRTMHIDLNVHMTNGTVLQTNIGGDNDVD